jgi:hypothetical protein
VDDTPITQEEAGKQLKNLKDAPLNMSETAKCMKSLKLDAAQEAAFDAVTAEIEAAKLFTTTKACRDKAEDEAKARVYRAMILAEAKAAEEATTAAASVDEDKDAEDLKSDDDDDEEEGDGDYRPSSSESESDSETDESDAKVAPVAAVAVTTVPVAAAADPVKALAPKDVRTVRSSVCAHLIQQFDEAQATVLAFTEAGMTDGDNADNYQMAIDTMKDAEKQFDAILREEKAEMAKFVDVADHEVYDVIVKGAPETGAYAISKKARAKVQSQTCTVCQSLFTGTKCVTCVVNEVNARAAANAAVKRCVHGVAEIDEKDMTNCKQCAKQLRLWDVEFSRAEREAERKAKVEAAEKKKADDSASKKRKLEELTAAQISEIKERHNRNVDGFITQYNRDVAVANQRLCKKIKVQTEKTNDAVDRVKAGPWYNHYDSEGKVVSTDHTVDDGLPVSPAAVSSSSSGSSSTTVSPPKALSLPKDDDEWAVEIEDEAQDGEFVNIVD